MTSRTATPNFIAGCAILLGILALAAPASAQWSRVTALPVTNVFGLFSNADTIVASVDTATYVSMNAGASWKRSAKPVAGVAAITAVRMRNHRLYAGTFGQGVFASDDLGDTWIPFNDGLVGGLLDSQLDIDDLEVRGDSLFAATAGAGVYVRGFAAGQVWHHFGDVFEPDQASNVNAIAVGANRLLACAGANGMVFRRDPGAAEWTESFLDNVGLTPSVTAQSALWTGAEWLVGTNGGVFRSVAGQEPWTHYDPGVGPLGSTAFAVRQGRAFAAFVTANAAFMETSGDQGASWQLMESLPHVFVFRLAVNGTTLHAARTDGLWVRAIDSVSVPAGGGAGGRLHFSLAGPQPIANDVRLHFDLERAGDATIAVFDARGRRVGDRISGAFDAGPHEVAWDAGSLVPGVYSARLSVGGAHATVRLVRVR